MELEKTTDGRYGLCLKEKTERRQGQEDWRIFQTALPCCHREEQQRRELMRKLSCNELRDESQQAFEDSQNLQENKLSRVKGVELFKKEKKFRRQKL